MSGRLEGKKAVITGGSRGIGRALVQRFHAEGATVLFTYARNDKAAAEVQGLCPGVEAVKCDGADRDEVEAIVDRFRAAGEGSGPQILVNNAGISVNAYFPMMTTEDWDRVLLNNLQTAYHWARAVFKPMLMDRAGSMVNLASVSGLFGVAGQTAYSASKGALLAFGRALAAEGAAKGVRVNTLVPGFIETEMVSKIPRPLRNSYKDRIAMKRFGTVEEVASAALFLCSDESSYITGQALILDGGLTGVVSV